MFSQDPQGVRWDTGTKQLAIGLPHCIIRHATILSSCMELTVAFHCEVCSITFRVGGTVIALGAEPLMLRQYKCYV